MSWAVLERFEPSELRQALRAIEDRHRRAAEIDDSERSSRIERVRELLRTTEDDRVPLLCARLTRRDLFLLPDLIAAETEPAIERRACLLAGAAKLGEIPRRTWKLTVEQGPHSGLHAVLRAYREPRWLAEIVSYEVDVPRVERWIAAETLEAGLAGDREREHAATVEEWASDLPPMSTPLDPASPLWPAIWCELLQGGSRRVLAAERSSTLIERAQSLGTAVVDAFVVNYLVRFRSGRAWETQIIDWAIRKHGRPTADSVVGVWRRAETRDPGVVTELLSWLALRTLGDFFRSVNDPGGRFEFWKKHFGHLLLEAHRLCGGEAAALRFPGVVVVEFANYGNAAYVYPDSQLSWVLRSQALSPSDLKDLGRVIRLHSGDFRIIHGGEWQRSAAERMTQAIRLHGGR